MDFKRLIEEAYTDKPTNNNCKEPAHPGLDGFKRMSLFDIAEKLDSKPDVYVMDRED